MLFISPKNTIFQMSERHDSSVKMKKKDVMTIRFS